MTSGSPQSAPGVPDGRGAVFFDLYGTLIDIRTDEEDPSVYAALAQYLSYFQVAIGAEALREEYRKRVRAQLEWGAGQFPEVDVFEIFRNILATYGEKQGVPSLAAGDVPADVTTLVHTTAILFRSLTRRHFAVFPDVHPVLTRLQTRYRLGLISDAQWVFTEPELEMSGLDRFFPVRILSSRIGVRKPDPRIFTAATRALGVPTQTAVYIGDNPPRDLVGAHNAGMKCFLFRGGEAEYNGLKPDASFQSYGDLEAALDRHFNDHASP
ncbi:MAG TPA: HAD family hydrolase [bacterium]|nr:HAD family hydrolase [bacterium]